MKVNRRQLLMQLSAGVAASALLQSRSTAAGTGGLTQAFVEPVAPHGPIYLNHNENAYGASAKALEAMKAAAAQASRYPDGSGLSLREALARHHTELRGRGAAPVSAEQIVLGCGSSDVLRMAAAFLKGSGRLIQAAPTCELLSGFARSKGATVVDVPLRKDHAHDLAAMLQKARSGGSGLIYICNPNTPTGTLTTRQDLERFLSAVPAGFHVVVDEAYHAYAGGSGAYASLVDRPVDNPRVIVTRTFSTGYGLAGARVGYGVAEPQVVEKMGKEGLPYPVSTGGIAGATAALLDPQHLTDCTKRNFDDRQEFMNQVNARMLRALDSHSNFVCLNVMRPAGEIFEHYRKNNFVLAPLLLSLPTYLRISLGTPEEMATFWKTWDLLGSHPMSM